MTERTSYAQINEDITLWNLVGHEKNTGFYIDVGANDPEHFSVSKSFYDAGWTGINIEPQAGFVHALKKAQPESLTLQMGLSNQRGSECLWVSTKSDQDGWATFNEEIAKAHGFTTRVSCLISTLAHVCERWGVPDSYDWLKIDVEGMELQVLQGNDWGRWRPNFLCIESIEPVHQKPSHGVWEDFITSKGYKMVDHDLYNRYYQRREM
jgi:FkbM family methyltransferase